MDKFVVKTKRKRISEESESDTPIEEFQRSFSLDIHTTLQDKEDVIRNAIYESIHLDILTDINDCDYVSVPEISEFLQLTNDPLCRELGHSMANCGDKFDEIGRMLRRIGYDVESVVDLEEMFHSVHSSYQLSRIILNCVFNLERLLTLVYFAYRLILRKLQNCAVVGEIKGNINRYCGEFAALHVIQRAGLRNYLIYRYLKRMKYAALPVGSILLATFYFST